MCRSIFLFVLLLSWASPVVAVVSLQVATPDPIHESWRWRTFDTSNGLAGGVRDIFEDRDGDIWFATDGGAQRYDGLHWTTYTTADGLADNRVQTVIQTRDGAMWFGAWGGGITRFDGETWTIYTTHDGLATNRVGWRRLIEARDGSMWAGCQSETESQGVICRFDGATWTTVEMPPGIPRLAAIASIQEIYACLSDLLDVEYEYAESQGAENESPLSLEDISLPEDLYRRLKEAAEFSQVTELEKILDEVESTSPEAVRLAGHLRDLNQDFKMDKILGILEDIKHG